MNFWYDVLNIIKGATSVLVIASGLIGVIAILFFSLLKIKKTNLAIFISTILSCFLMIPTISAFNNLVDTKIKEIRRNEFETDMDDIRRQKLENSTLIVTEKALLDMSTTAVRVISLEVERLNTQIIKTRQSIEIKALDDNIKLLEHTQLSVQSFQKILELALLQTELKRTVVKKEPIGRLEEGWGIRANYYYDEILVVLTHDIIAKFGVNLNEIRVTKINENTVAVFGIRSRFIGASRNVINTLVSEIRRVNYKSGVVDSVDILNDRRGEANARERSYQIELQTRLNEEFRFMDDTVIQLAQNFIQVMLAPLYQNIIFDNAVRPNSLPLMEYLKEQANINERLRETLTRQLETEQNIPYMEEDI